MIILQECVVVFCTQCLSAVKNEKGHKDYRASVGGHNSINLSPIDFLSLVLLCVVLVIHIL